MTKAPHYTSAAIKAAILACWRDPIALGEAMGYNGSTATLAPRVGSGVEVPPLAPGETALPRVSNGLPDPSIPIRRKRFGNFHREMLAHVHSQTKTSTIVPRGHAKSTLITVVDTVHHLLHNPESRNLLASATLDLARKLVGEVRDRLNGDLEILPGLYMPLREVFP